MTEKIVPYFYVVYKMNKSNKNIGIISFKTVRVCEKFSVNRI